MRLLYITSSSSCGDRLVSAVFPPLGGYSYNLVQWDLSIKDTLNKGYFSNEDTVCSHSHIELCTNLPLNKGHLSIQDSQLGPSGVHYREVPLHKDNPVISILCMC